MSNATITSTNNLGDQELSALLPVNPFRSLLVHFGMLLGVDDFETLDAYHRGKMWMHTAWLHREGAVWGLNVSLFPENNEIRVSRGLALDALGREMYLEADACLNVGQWYEEHKDDPELKLIVQEDPDGTVHFDAHVVIKFRGCLARQVPALNEPCDDSGTTTAYSRVVETVELLLKPGKAPLWREPPGSLPYHRLRLLFALESPIEEEGVVIPSDQEVMDARAAIFALPREEQPAAYLEVFRRFAALDEIDMAPAAGEEGEAFTLFPARDPAPIPLADVMEISLQPAENGWNLTGGNVDNTVRPVHVATSTIQELLCGPLFLAPDAGGPRIDPATVGISGNEITFEVDAELLEASVDIRSISVTSFDESTGWIDEAIGGVTYDGGIRKVTVQLNAAPTGNRLRLIVKGTGEFPLLGSDGIPLAGAVGGPPGSAFNGNDFVYMFNV